jgi:hypothetical protein
LNGVLAFLDPLLRGALIVEGKQPAPPVWSCR